MSLYTDTQPVSVRLKIIDIGMKHSPRIKIYIDKIKLDIQGTGYRYDCLPIQGSGYGYRYQYGAVSKNR